MSDQIQITHTSEEGTLATGDTRPHAAILKGHSWRWSRNLTAWYVPNSRDRLPHDFQIKRTAERLEAAGATVTLDISREVTSAAEREANRAERIEARQDALDAKATRKATESTARYNAASAIASRIPLGQPILVGHHSERGARADQKRIAGHMDKSCEFLAESNEAARKAAASERNQAHRLTAPATMRRIERLETEQRDISRKLTQATEGGHTDWHARLTERAEILADDIDYWKGHLSALAAEGVKLWSAADFQKGDLALTRFGARRIVRVNKKSLSVESGYSWTDTLPYDHVRGRIPADQAPAPLAIN